MDTIIYTITHKRYIEPKESAYKTLHVGRTISEDLGYEGDNTGDNISDKNKNFCELTGMYWIWKNVSCDIVGICHYRRYFIDSSGNLLSKKYIEDKLLNYDIIVPISASSQHENNYEHYKNVHFIDDMMLCWSITIEKYPEYEKAFEIFLNTNLASLGNMVITKKKIYDQYCEWLFDILFEVEKRVDISEYDEFQARLFGYLSERLFRIWLFMQKYKIKEERVELIDTSEKIGRLIVMTGVYDTLDIFAYELIKDFRQMGYEVMEFDSSDMTKSLGALGPFIEQPVKAVITFNNLGFNMELTEGTNTWEVLEIPVINILMDHPYFHKKALDNAPRNAIVLCPDKDHMSFLWRFYPSIAITGFLGHGGKQTQKAIIPVQDRNMDILYCGGISTPFIEQTMPDFSEFDFDAKYVSEIAYKMLIDNPDMTVSDAIERALINEGVNVTDEELVVIIEKLRFVDMRVVSYYREKILEKIALSGLDVTIYGTGWEIYDWINLPNVHFMGRISAEYVLDKMADAKLVLNTMTWFKNGTHDRIFNGMLAGAVVATDSSIYMKEEFNDDELIMFDLDEIDLLPDKIRNLLGDANNAQKMADLGRKKALKSHTWHSRARELHEDLLSQL